MKTENIGPVTAWCDQNDSPEVCLRVLEDQVCKMGGDVMWQVDGPRPQGDKQRMNGRAGHTKEQAAQPARLLEALEHGVGRRRAHRAIELGLAHLGAAV